MPQVANGLRIYFDKALQQLLLYTKEQDMAAKVGVNKHCCEQVMIAMHTGSEPRLKSRSQLKEVPATLMTLLST